MGYYWGYRPYVPVAKRQQNAARAVARLAAKGRVITPVKTEGRKIATTFWGKAWCDNLAAYGDYANRLPRGRRYVCNGSVVDLQIQPGEVTALVSGSELYNVSIRIGPLNHAYWKAIRKKCAGQIGSLVELLQGKLSASVMSLVTNRKDGLFPKPGEIEVRCSCPDSAWMCKHVAAVMYGIGTRLDAQPDLLFSLRKVDHMELISEAGTAVVTAGAGTAQTIPADELADVFGIDLAPDSAPTTQSVAVANPKKASKKSSGSIQKRGMARKPSKPKSVLKKTPGKLRRGRTAR